MSENAIVIQVPATTSNCGPGFDALAIALDLHNYVEVARVDHGRIEWRGRDALRGGTLYMVEEAADAWFKAAGIAPHGFAFDIWGEVPASRGLGSSATIRCGILAALDALHGGRLGRDVLVRLAAKLDHAPDGVSAAFHGGFCISRSRPGTGEYLGTQRFDVAPGIRFVAVSPDHEVATPEARAVLPKTVPFREAVDTVNAVAWLVAALVSGRFDRLPGSGADFLHQPYRQLLNPFASEAIEAGRGAGAWEGWLSGSGSTVVCAAPPERGFAVGQAMAAIFQTRGGRPRVFQLEPDNAGLGPVAPRR